MWDLVCINCNNGSFMCDSQILLLWCANILLIEYLKLNTLPSPQALSLS